MLQLNAQKLKSQHINQIYQRSGARASGESSDGINTRVSWCIICVGERERKRNRKKKALNQLK
jgi:hypothetical protein